MRKRASLQVAGARREYIGHRLFIIFLWLFILLSGVCFYVSRQELSAMAWESFNNPETALFLNADAGLASKIGDYYFNVDASGKVYDLLTAAKYYQKSLRLDPNMPIAWHQLARIDFLRGNFPRALDEVNHQIALHGDALINAYYVRGLIDGYSSHLDEATADFDYFLKKKPDSWAARNDLAWIYFQQGDFKNVETVAREGLKYHSDNPWLLTSLGVALLNLDKKTEAKKTLTEAKAAAESLTVADWGRAYPGNNPKFYGDGLEKMKAAIDFNLNLASS